MTRYLTVREAADGCSLTEKTIRRAIDRGDLPAVRPRGTRRVLIDVAVLDRWLEPVAVGQDPVPAPAVASRQRKTGAGSPERLRAIEGGRG